MGVCGCQPDRHERYGRLIVVRRQGVYESPAGRRIQKYRCRCDCGNFCAIRIDALNSQTTRSCGCLRREVSKARSTIHGVDGMKEHEA